MVTTILLHSNAKLNTNENKDLQIFLQQQNKFLKTKNKITKYTKWQNDTNFVHGSELLKVYKEYKHLEIRKKTHTQTHKFLLSKMK